MNHINCKSIEPLLWSEPHRCVSSRLEQAFQQPGKDELNHLLADLGDQNRLADIKQAGWKLADASEAHRYLLSQWQETLTPPQKQAFQTGCDQRTTLLKTVRELPIHLETDDFKNLYDTSKGVRNILQNQSDKGVQWKALTQEISRVEKEGLVEAHTFDKLVVKIAALLPGTVPSRLLLGLIPGIDDLPKDTRPTKIEWLLTLLPAMPLRCQADGLVALMEVMPGSSLSRQEALAALRTMKGLIQNLKPLTLWKEPILKWAETAQWYSWHMNLFEEAPDPLHGTLALFDALRLSGMETTSLKLATILLRLPDFPEFERENVKDVLIKCFEEALKKNRRIGERSGRPPANAD